MNANELADEFQNKKDWKLINYIHWSEQSETMLRQQQAEIEALKQQRLEYADAVLEALDWGSYASEYFQGKHGWHEEVDKWVGITRGLRNEK